ncbi:restriction endonuclease subunit S [Wohlfahrtiimonas chitiniclastica]|uniref:restriction endonuclease subunit S n=1 Tax=Wohlfahrtiimonas chitiniclastica TaxID=400946 RepID=UPI000B99AB85|nr:restriction endonuclease subunit S [Wohlfahrtiimonas chitiniclastica]OYQ85619.1 hypothetical protein B9T14_03775 [Wohlfahrtiimonas chitiniclastica]OYQ86145.1 hypothetical protein B9T15_01255 [Wohlfahrtiimonas chitiniclastica]
MVKGESHIPKLRFKGFSDGWKTTRLNDICSHFQSGKGITTNDIYDNAEYPVYGGNGLRGYTHTFTHEGLFALIGRQGALCGNINLVGGKNYISEHAVAVQADSNNDTQWLSYLLDLMNLGKLSESSAQPGLAVNKLVRLKVNAPSKIEQTKIGNFFQKIDQVIELQQKALDTARDYKKSMLQKMFPQKGEKVPQIRFDGFSGDWEEKKVGEISKTTFGGGTPNTKVLEYWKGDIPWIQSSDILIDNVLEFKPTKFINSEAVKNSATKIVPKNSLAIVTRVGVGKLALVEFEYTTSQDFLSLSYLKYDLLFSLYSLYILLQEEKNKTQGTAIKGITKVDFLSKNIFIPLRKEEQQKIGEFFQKLDQRIEQHEKKLQSYQNLKKAMLQRLFV